MLAYDANERLAGQIEQLFPALPGQDRFQRVGAGDEIQLRVGVERVQVAQRVPGVGGPAAVDVHAAHREAGIGRGGDHRHQVPVLRSRDVAALLPGLTAGHEHDFVEVEQVGNLAGGDQVAVMDGIERPAHHAEPAKLLLHGLPAYLRVRMRPGRRPAVNGNL